MKSFILTIGTLLISYPLVAQTNFTGSGISTGPTTQTSPVTGAPVFGPSNTAPIPPSSTGTNFGTGTEVQPGTDNFGTGTGVGTGLESGPGTDNFGTGTSFGTGGSSSPIPPETRFIP